MTRERVLTLGLCHHEMGDSNRAIKLFSDMLLNDLNPYGRGDSIELLLQAYIQADGEEAVHSILQTVLEYGGIESNASSKVKDLLGIEG